MFTCSLNSDSLPLHKFSAFNLSLCPGCIYVFSMKFKSSFIWTRYKAAKCICCCCLVGVFLRNNIAQIGSCHMRTVKSCCHLISFPWPNWVSAHEKRCISMKSCVTSSQSVLSDHFEFHWKLTRGSTPRSLQIERALWGWGLGIESLSSPHTTRSTYSSKPRARRVVSVPFRLSAVQTATLTSCSLSSLKSAFKSWICFKA